MTATNYVFVFSFHENDARNASTKCIVCRIKNNLLKKVDYVVEQQSTFLQLFSLSLFALFCPRRSTQILLNDSMRQKKHPWTPALSGNVLISPEEAVASVALTDKF